MRIILNSIMFLLLCFFQTEIKAAASGSEGKSGIKLQIKADEIISARVNECIKQEIQMQNLYVLDSTRPAIIVNVLARHILEGMKQDEKQGIIVLSAVYMAAFDNDAVIKHWASGFRQGFPYAAQIALLKATNGLLRLKSHQVEAGKLPDLPNMCKSLVNKIKTFVQ